MTEVERQTPTVIYVFQAVIQVQSHSVFCVLSLETFTQWQNTAVSSGFRVLNMVIFTYGLVIHNMTIVFYYSDVWLWSNSRPAIVFL